MNELGTAQARDRCAVTRTLLRVSHALVVQIEASLATVGLSMPKFLVLDHLVRARENLTLGELATRMWCVRSNVTQLIDRMEDDGLVRRVNDPDDRRSIRAAITRAGTAKHAQGAKLLDREERAVRKRLSIRDHDHLMKLLENLARSSG
jgi:DNA-binding MarR family transcriptional regulator